MNRNTLIVILLSSLAGALRSQPVLPALNHALPSRATADQAAGKLADSDDAKYRELLAFLRDNLVSEGVCEARPRPMLASQR